MKQGMTYMLSKTSMIFLHTLIHSGPSFSVIRRVRSSVGTDLPQWEKIVKYMYSLITFKCKQIQLSDNLTENSKYTTTFCRIFKAKGCWLMVF